MVGHPSYVPANSTAYGSVMKCSPVPNTGHAHSGTFFKLRKFKTLLI